MYIRKILSWMFVLSVIQIPVVAFGEECQTNADCWQNADCVSGECKCWEGYFFQHKWLWNIGTTTGYWKDSCEPCQIGTFKDEVSNATECTPCYEGAITEEEGATSSYACTCDKGYGEVHGEVPNGWKCVECSPGYYKDEIGHSACSKCPDLPDSDRYVYTHTGETDPNCPYHQLCEKDWQGYNFSTSQCECAKGWGHIEGNNDSCTICGYGYYKDSVGDVSCTKCPDDKTTLKVGATSDAECQSIHAKFNIPGTNNIWRWPYGLTEVQYYNSNVH